MATLDDLLAVGDLPLLDKTTHRLPADTEATLPAALNKGVANGVAALNASGLPVTATGVPMATIGTTSGTAADAALTATALAGKAVIGTTAGTAADAAAVATALAGKAATASIPPEAETSRNLFPVANPGGTLPYKFPPRYAWNGPVIFNMKGLSCERPGNDGQLTGGGGMYPLIDELKT